MKLPALLLICAATLAAHASPTQANDTTQPLPAFERVLQMSPPRAIAPFTLTDHLGKRRDWSTFAGTPTLVFFGFTNCPDICPTTLQKLAQLKTSHSAALQGVQVVLISVDGERDTPAVMSEYLASFSKDFIGLTGPAAEVREIALRFSAPFFKDPPKDGAYVVQHSSRLYAIDRRGRLRAELYDATTEATTGIARALLAER